jgi:hypothetical protein
VTEQSARRIANVAIGAAAVGAAYVVLRTPTLRRRAWQLARTAVAASLPWLAAEVRQAWAESGRRRPEGMMRP